jgi:hypothetical protein
LRNDLLTVVYDLRVLPYTYDIVPFLAIAEGKRKLLSPNSKIRLIVITGRSRRQADWDWNGELSSAAREAEISSRLLRVTLPASQLFPSIQSIDMVNESAISGEIPAFYPESYSFISPKVGVYHKSHYLMNFSRQVDLRALSNDQHALDLAARYLRSAIGSDSPVVFTLRNNIFSFDQSRNSRAELNRELFGLLRRLGFPVAVIPDTSMTALDQLPADVPVLRAPAFDLKLRSAIYEQARFCLFEPTGPMALAWFNANVKFIAYGMAWSRYFSERYHIDRGYKRDENIVSPDNPRQLYLWGDLSPSFLDNWIRDYL